MTLVTVRNLGPGLRAVKNAAQQSVTLRPGDSRKVEMHPIHAQMLLQDASRPNPKFSIDIDPDERVKMEEEVAKTKMKPGAPVSAEDAPRSEEANRARAALEDTGVRKPPKKETRFITDPKPSDKPNGGKMKKKAKSARELRIERRKRRRREREDEDDE